MRYKYIVVARHDSERNSWIECGDIRHFESGHRTYSAASVAAARAHIANGGCDGSNSLANILEYGFPIRGRSGNPTQKFERFMAAVNAGNAGDWYEHDGHIYCATSIWNHIEFVPSPGACNPLPGVGVRVHE